MITIKIMKVKAMMLNLNRILISISVSSLIIDSMKFQTMSIVDDSSDLMVFNSAFLRIQSLEDGCTG